MFAMVGRPLGQLPRAIIALDMQRAFVTGPNAIPDAAGVTAAVHFLIARARAAGALVVHLQNDGLPGALDEPNTSGWGLVTDPQPGEPVIRKTQDDGFGGTDLEGVLAGHGARTLVICGVQSEMCVAATARGAMHRGHSVILPRDAHGTYPVPADGTGGIYVPAAHVSRVAEWALGDELVAPTSSLDVTFSRNT